MTDYLKIYEKFKDVKEVKDYIDDVILLRSRTSVITIRIQKCDF